MPKPIRHFRQEDYSRVLDECKARQNGLTQTECTKILMDHGLTYHQAKDGAYVYLHHGRNLAVAERGTQDEYDRILTGYDARNKTAKNCVEHLKSLGYSYGQAKTAVYKYRVAKGLIRKKL
jgi:hypothetical protein